MKVKELFESDEFAGFSPSQVSDIERNIDKHVDDNVEVLSISAARSHDLGDYVAYIVYDGTNNKANKGNIYFKCSKNGNKHVSDFDIVDFTGSNYKAKPKLAEEAKVRRVPAGTFTPPKAAVKGRDPTDPNFDKHSPFDNPTGKMPQGLPHKVDGKYNKDNYPIVFYDAEDSTHLFDPSLIKHIKQETPGWNKMDELDQIKLQMAYVSLPPTKATMDKIKNMSKAEFQKWHNAAEDKEAKKLQSQIKRG